MTKCVFAPFALLAIAAAPAAAPSPAEIVSSAPAAAWQDIAQEDLLEMTLANGSVVTIQLVH
ncbi:MAG: peptidylprolyl isomerase, partial [Sphingomonadaceae bacterium]|nr:peptidylprolyl isomerase [Sphingomonadaceae bacterium]